MSTQSPKDPEPEPTFRQLSTFTRPGGRTVVYDKMAPAAWISFDGDSSMLVDTGAWR